MTKKNAETMFFGVFFFMQHRGWLVGWYRYCECTSDTCFKGLLFIV